MAIKLRKLIMLSILFPLGLGAGLSSGEVNVLSTPTKEAISYTTSDDLNNHDTNHSSDYNWVAISTLDYEYGYITITGGNSLESMSYYYLDKDIDLGLVIYKYVTICLNGKYIDANSNGSVIYVVDGAYFNLCDCSENGSGLIKGGNTSDRGGGVWVEYSTFNMYGGTISNNTSYGGGGVYAYYGRINIYGGTISNNTSYGAGGGVYAYYGVINIYGGSTISYNTANGLGGGIYVEGTTINMYDGIISENTADDSSGGGVLVYEGTFNMYGGTISGNTATYTFGGGGGVLVDMYSTFTMYGGTISGNTANNGGVYVGLSTFNMIGGYFDNDIFDEDATNISITGGYFSSTAYDSVKNYIADGYIAKATGDNTWPYVVVDLYTYFNDHAHDDWTLFSDSSGGTLEGGSNQSGMKYYYLNEDIELSSNDITISGYVTLCLNGNTIKGTGDSPVISVVEYAYFNLCDCSGDDRGIITGGDTNYGGGLYVNGNATFNMYGGTISGNTAITYGGGVYVNNSSTFNMYGGKITDNTSNFHGGGIYTLSTFNMYGGIIKNNNAGYGGGVYALQGTFSMYGGTISSNEATDGGGVIVGSYCTFNMYDGTISGNTVTSSGSGVFVTSENAFFKMYGGYFDNNMHTDASIRELSISIYGGYFSSEAYSGIQTIWIATGYQIIDISPIGSDLDENYKEGYPYAVYKTYTMTDTISSVAITYGTTYTPNITDNYTSVAYTWKDASNIIVDVDAIVGFPTDVGEYIVTAYFLYTTVEDNITTNYYFTGNEFTVTISKGQAAITADATQSKTYDGEVASVDYTVIVGDTDITSDATVTETWYDEDGESISSAPTEVGTYKVTLTVVGTDNYDGTSVDVTYTITENTSSSTPSDEEDGTDNTSDGGTTTSTDSTGLSAGAIAGIVIASVFVVGLIAFLVYFFVFRKRKGKVS